MAKLELDIDIEAAAIDIAEDLIERGLEADVAIEATADALDRLVPFDKLVPGLPGIVLEANDDDIFETVLKWLHDLIKGDPVKRAERKAFRQSIRGLSPKEKREARRLWRASRV
jgi:hypothetical protein